MNYIALDPTDHLYWMGMEKLLWENSQPSMDQSLQVGCFWGVLKGNPCLPLPVSTIPVLPNPVPHVFPVGQHVLRIKTVWPFHLQTRTRNWLCLHTHTHACAHICAPPPPTHTHTHVHTHACMCTCEHTHTHSSLWCWPIFSISGEWSCNGYFFIVISF